MPSAALSATELCLVGGADDRLAVRRAGRPPPTPPIHRRLPRPLPHISGMGPALAAPAAPSTVAAAVALLVGGRRRHGERGFRAEKAGDIYGEVRVKFREEPPLYFFTRAQAGGISGLFT